MAIIDNQMLWEIGDAQAISEIDGAEEGNTS